MCLVCITENGSTVGIRGGSFVVANGETEEHIPKETVDGISFFGKSQMTYQGMQYCMENGIKVSYFTEAGRYLGCVDNHYSFSSDRIRRQFVCTEDDDFCLAMAKKIVKAKINNQIVVAKRYMRKDQSPKERLFHLRNAKRKVDEAVSIQQVMGYEGIAARTYFGVLSENMPEGFAFRMRNMHPSKDPFNAMLSFGYSLLTKEVVGELINRRMLPQVGFLHNEHDRMPALACDLVEEWRAAIVDSTVLSLIHGNEIMADMFEMNDGICKMNSEAIRILLSKIENKMHTEIKYLSYISKPMSFRKALWHQAEKFGRVIDTGDVSYYEPILLR